jgi:hypothetical protein
MNPSILCTILLVPKIGDMLIYSRRTYDDEDQGEAIREGFEPNDLPIAAPSDFAVGEDEDDDDGSSSRGRDPQPIEGLDDRHVWDDSGTGKGA